MKEGRRGYEFNNTNKNWITFKSKGKCVATGQRKYAQYHHQIPIWYAKENNIDKRLIRHHANGVLLEPHTHNQLHNEQRDWDEDKWAIYANALISHIKEVLSGKVPMVLQESKMPIDYDTEANLGYAGAAD